MADNHLALLLEAERRGLAIDDEDRAMLAEARRRGLIEAPAPATPSDRPTFGGAVRRVLGNRVDEAVALPGRVAGAVGDWLADPKIPSPADLIPKPSLRVVLPLVAGGNPLVQAAVGAGSEALSQGMEMRAGERERFDPVQVGVAGAVPLAVTGVVRGGRALARTATRTIPSLFQRAQSQALQGAEDVAAELTPEVSAQQLFDAARGRTAPAAAPKRTPIAALPPVGGTSPTAYGPTGRFVAGELSQREGVDRTLDAASAAARGEAYREGAGMAVAGATPGPSVAGRVMRLGEAPTTAAAKAAAETVPAGRITRILDDLDDSIPKAPADAGLQQVRTAMKNIRSAVKGGSVDLAELLRQRLDLGRMIARRGSAPELRAIYGHGGQGAKGIIGALEEAAEAGGTGAAAAKEALTVFKRDLGVMTWRDLVEQSTKRTSISGVDTPALNVARLGQLVEKHGDELAAQLGPEGMALVRGFLSKSRTLPPTHAMTLGRSLIAAMVGSGAGLGFGSVPIGLGAALVPEIATNVFAVGRNPVWVNQLMVGLAQAARSAAPPLTLPVAVGPDAQEAARGR